MDVSPETDDNSSINNDTVPHAMAFTVHFDNDKQSSLESFNKFTRRHIRNLSLPIAKVYDNKVTPESLPVNGKQSSKKAGNHSEGYFSSDPDEDPAKPKLFVAKVRNSENKISNPTNLAQGKKNMSCTKMKDSGKLRQEEDIEDEEISDVVSETGTYTIDKESPDVTTARLNIDNAFGIHNKTSETQIKFQMSSTHGKSTWINEWATQVVEHNHLGNTDSQFPSKTNNSTTNGGITKIPSPINTRARLPPMTQPMKSEHHEVPLRNVVPNQRLHAYAKSHEECSDSSLETECFLKATERVVTAMAARVSMALDSGGESDVDTNSLSQVKNAPATDSSASESGQKPTATRYNRAFSLRRGRLDEPKKEITPVREPAPLKAMPPRVTKRESAPPVPSPSPSFSRTDCGRFSMRVQKPAPQSPLMSTVKKDVKKKSSNCNRSNSTLSSKEVEFQNWKRRKSYDPMKAAAEGKKKEAARKQPPPSNPMTQSTITTPKSPVNPVLRSASFHGTRQLAASSSDDEEEEEVILSAEEEDWPVLQVPRSSLENTPQGSHISLYSNNSASSLRARPKLEKNSRTSQRNCISKGKQEEEGVDTLVISALSGLSSKLKGSSCTLLKKLRYLYDEDSPKGHQLSAEIEQLEVTEPSSPQVKSPSRELSTTLRNLKRIETMLKVLDDVLFDEEDFQ